MKYLKNYNIFLETTMTEPKTAPSPGTAPTKPRPDTKPNRPSRPSPIRRDRPAVQPDPMAEKEDELGIKKSTEDEVIERFIKTSKKLGFDYKKYIK
jgi:hypothetical protein